MDGDKMDRTEEYHEVDGRTERIPIQCDTCKHWVYLNGSEVLCTNPKYKGNQRLGASLTGDARKKCLYNDWEWCGY